MRLIIPSLVWQGPLFCRPPRRSGNLWMPIGFHASWGWTRTYFYGVPDSALYCFVLFPVKTEIPVELCHA